MKKIKRRIAPLVLAAALLPLAAQAHMSWLLPNNSHVTGKEPVVSIDAAVSEALFVFERGLKLDTLRITGPDGAALEADNRASARNHDSFDLKLLKDGTYRISNTSHSLIGSYTLGGETKRLRSTPAAFDKDLPAGAVLNGVMLTTSRQQTFVSKEDAGTPAFTPEGQGLELLPLSPVTDLSHGDRSRMRLLLDGQPLADATLSVLRDGNRYRYKLGEITLKTDAQGEFSIHWTEPGRYWLGVSHGGRPPMPAASASAAAPPPPLPAQAGTREVPLKRASLSATFEVLPK